MEIPDILCYLYFLIKNIIYHLTVLFLPVTDLKPRVAMSTHNNKFEVSIWLTICTLSPSIFLKFPSNRSISAFYRSSTSGGGGTTSLSDELSSCSSYSSLSETGDSGFKPRKRDSWTSKVQFILACVGYSIGIGNLWRFPYLAYKSGGGELYNPYRHKKIYNIVPYM